MTVIGIFLAWFFAILFLLSGILKLRQIKRFGYQIEAFNILPYRIIPLVAWSIPSLEIGIGLWLATYPTQIAEWAALSLIGVFTVFLTWALLTNRRQACFCFGESDGSISAVTLYRNGVLLLLGIFAISLDLDTPTQSNFVAPCAALIAGAAVLVFISFFQIQVLSRKAHA